MELFCVEGEDTMSKDSKVCVSELFCAVYLLNYLRPNFWSQFPYL